MAYMKSGQRRARRLPRIDGQRWPEEVPGDSASGALRRRRGAAAGRRRGKRKSPRLSPGASIASCL